jgi:large subunit ribosomal protein L7/L12
LSADQILKVDKLFHKILWLDMFETAILVELINERLGKTLSPKQRAALQRQMDLQIDGGAANAAKGAVKAEKDEGPKLVDLKLTGYDAAKKIKVIKEVRSIAGLGLKEAKELVEGAPKVIQKGLKPEQAEELKQMLESAGAQVELT